MLLLGCGIYIALPGSGVRPTQGTLVRYIEVLASQWKATPLDAAHPGTAGARANACAGPR